MLLSLWQLLLIGLVEAPVTNRNEAVSHVFRKKDVADATDRDGRGWHGRGGHLFAPAHFRKFATNVVTADQYIAIVLPGRMFKGAFQCRGLAPVVLSRTIGAAGTPTSALIPWNSCGAYMAATLCVATFSYAPYAIFCFMSPLLAVAIAYAGIRMPRLAEPPAQEQPNGPSPRESDS